MASIYRELAVDVGSETAWAALRVVGDAHKLFAPVLVDAELDGDTRTVRFANGMTLHERILDLDDEKRRVAYAAVDGPGMTYHHASMQIVPAGPGRCLFVWITDFQPYQPQLDTPTAWAVSPIGMNGKVQGVMAVPVPIAKINRIMTAGKRWEDAGMGPSTETYLAGADD